MIPNKTVGQLNYNFIQREREKENQRERQGERERETEKKKRERKKERETHRDRAELYFLEVLISKILHIFEKFQQKIKNKDFSDIYNVLGPILELATKTATKTLKSTKNMMATKF